MRGRTIAILALGGLMATVAGSAAALTVNGGVLQAGESVVACDANGIDANWGLETDDNTVRTVRFSDIDATCVGAELFVKLYSSTNTLLFSGDTILTALPSQTINIPAPYLTPESIDRVKVWLEG